MHLLESRNVLVVEDERIVAKDLQRSLQNLGYQVPVTVATADDAIREASGRCPDLVLMDVQIKGERDGIETAEILKSRFDVPVVYLTAYADPRTVERAKLTEPHAYLLKPVKVDELRTAVELALHKHESERRQRERERWAATTLRSLGDAVVCTDATGRVTLMNLMAETMTGLRSVDVRGRPLSQILEFAPEPGRAGSDDPVAEVLRSGRLRRVGGVLRTRAGRERVIAESAAPIVDDAGNQLGVVILFRDLAEPSGSERRLQFAERLSSLGTVAAGIAHEINNPLAFVVANLEFAQAELQRSAATLPRGNWLPELEGALREAQVGAARVTNIVADLRRFARPASQPHGRVDVNRVVSDAIALVEAELRAQTHLISELGEVPSVMANETRLGQVLVNLLVNAGQAVGTSGTPGEVRVRTFTTAAGRACIEVRDTGCGISPELQRRVFDPFFTTRETLGGAGLGLPVCQGILSSLGGDIAVQSQLGAGSVFVVTLPAAPPEAAEPLPAAPEALAARALRVLIVDDEPLVRTTISRMLAQDYAVTQAADAQEALALLTGGERFDVILSDVSMAGMTGIELHELLAARDPDQARRMVFLSGGAFSAETFEFLRRMAERHLEKPFALSQLRSVLSEQIQALGPVSAGLPLN